MKTRIKIIFILVIVVGLLLAANFTVYEEGDFDSLQDEVVIVCDINWLQKPINCKPVFPEGFDFNAGTGFITSESNWP
ncbi:hypothetical protein NZNM25_01880 [Nitrosopumilus zosterae]|uniref:Uncharacterized protein n=1 Tax=Nitrosopumilus zosterae TaxID=718286 RepID=A0A2S2KPA1_9ARCH|nr:hypothetical protein [Nitrosopumilus zosterae]BDQ31185.1 hypothetical protein NZOSNM25_001296 [Nitrosopumilus zosterae]GBH33397.1 hypothetical protein NZNM25_01880 [Nitrosopumilus zosterae]